MTRRWAFLLLASMCVPMLLGSGGGGHRLPAPQSREIFPPAGGWNPRRVDHLQEMGRYLGRRTLRIEAFHAPGPPFSDEYENVEDGVGVVLEPGKLLTTARYVEGAARLHVRTPGGQKLSASVERLDVDAGLALLSYPAEKIPEVKPLVGFAPAFSKEEQGAKEQEVVIPFQVEGAVVSVRLATVYHFEEDALLKGVLLNGVPAFDSRGRLVALADRTALDRENTLVVTAPAAKEWLEQVPQKNGPRGTKPRGPGP